MLTVMRSILALVLMVCAAPAKSHELKLQNLQIVHPWVHGPVTSGQTAPRDVLVYMTIFNRGGSQDRLIAASSPLAQSGELHEGAQTTQGIAFKPASAVKFADQGPIVVLHGVTDDLAGYEAFPVWLTFEHAGRVEVAVVVEDAAVRDPTCSGSLMPSEMHVHDHTQTK